MSDCEPLLNECLQSNGIWGTHTRRSIKAAHQHTGYVNLKNEKYVCVCVLDVFGRQDAFVCIRAT